jgi:hypothetical protein
MQNRTASSNEGEPSNARANARHPKGSGTFLLTFICKIEIRNRVEIVRGLLDPGSDTSYIHAGVVKRLGAVAERPLTLQLSRFGSDDQTMAESGVVTATLYNMSGLNKTCSLFMTSHIVGTTLLSPSVDEVLRLLPSNRSYADPDLFRHEKRPVQLLIGNNLYHHFVFSNCDERLSDGLVLLKTFFGCIPTGSIDPPFENSRNSQSLSLVASSKSNSEHEKIESKVQKAEFLRSPEISLLWDLEVLGIKLSELDPMAEIVLENFDKTVRFENGRYVVSWPWKQENPSLPKNYRLCV